MTRVFSFFRFAIVTSFLSSSLALHSPSMSIAINGGDPSAFPRPGINSPPHPHPHPHPHPPPPQAQAITPITAILGNLFGGLGGLPGFKSNPPPPHPPPPPPPNSPPQIHYLGQNSPEAIRDHRPQMPVDCSVTTIAGEDTLHSHMTKTYKTLKYNGQMDSTETSSSSNRSGICVANAFECKVRAGEVIGPCLARRGVNLPRTQMGVCCNSEVTCGQSVTMNGTYFKSPKFPNPYQEPGSCSVSIKDTYKNICQIRLDFDVFNLKQPVNGNCNSDRFVVSGHPNNVIVPSICGYNAGQHMYIDVDPYSGQYQVTSPSLLTLNVITSGMRHRWFNIRIFYIPCDSQLRAPKNCLQYFTSMVGQVKSFNYDLFNQGFTYFNNLDYTICFKKWPGFCTVTFEVPSSTEDLTDNLGNSETAGSFLPPFPELVSRDSTSPNFDSMDQFYDGSLNNHSPRQKNRQNTKYQHLIPSTDSSFLRRKGSHFQIISSETNYKFAASGPFKCPSDYLIVNCIRFCGNYFNEDSLYSQNIRSNAPVVDNSTGPIYIRFVTSVDTASKGFILNYQLNPCLLNGR